MNNLSINSTHSYRVECRIGIRGRFGLTSIPWQKTEGLAKSQAKRHANKNGWTHWRVLNVKTAAVVFAAKNDERVAEYAAGTHNAQLPKEGKGGSRRNDPATLFFERLQEVLVSGATVNLNSRQRKDLERVRERSVLPTLNALIENSRHEVVEEVVEA